MTMWIKQKALWLLALLLILMTNGVILSGVFGNRLGEPQAQLKLTERELALVSPKESSSLGFRLHWKTLPDAETPEYQHYFSFLTESKLLALGVEVEELKQKPKESRKNTKEKEVFVVLELEGKHYQMALRRAQNHLEQLALAEPDNKEQINDAKRELQRVQQGESRLYLIDAGLDAQELRELYPSRTQYLITKGILKTYFSQQNSEERLVGRIQRLSVTDLHLPLPYKKTLEGIITRNWSERDLPPRYQVQVSYGNRFEPWVTEVQPLN